jgi:ribonucleotide reductase alpha subunit
MEYLGIKLEPNRDSLIGDAGITRLKESYMKDDETIPQERFAFVSKAFATDDAHAQRLYDYSSKHWLSYSTPILSFGKSRRGLPISCYLNFIEDTAEGLVNTLSETNWLSMLGGGVGIGFGIRSSDDKSTGVLPHLKLYDASSLAYRQGKTRRGSYAAYLDISHPDIIQFLEMRKPTGDQNLRCQNLHHGVNISDKFMTIIEKCMKDPDFVDDFDLIDPNSEDIIETVSARSLWQKIMELRMQTGEPYLHFIDTSREALPQFLKDKGLTIHQSNLCVTGDTEITVFNKVTSDMQVVSIKKFIDDLINQSDWKVWSYNLETQTCEWAEISNGAMTNTEAEIIEIEDEETGKIIRCTPEHKIFTKNRGYVMAKDLTESDEMLLLKWEFQKKRCASINLNQMHI